MAYPDDQTTLSDAQKSQTILFVGDSITDCGRRDVAPPYGNGYVGLIQAMLLAQRPAERFRLLNRGVSGDTVRHLAARWESDVLAERPDQLSVLVGINDIWRGVTGRTAEAVPLDEYAATLHTLLARAQVVCEAQLILIEPFWIGADRADPVRMQVEDYAQVVARLAGEFKAMHIRAQAAFDAVLRYTTPSAWCDERNDHIHPGAAGHMLLALRWLRATGLWLYDEEMDA
jgi:lysophospholipase L1-like esterase